MYYKTVNTVVQYEFSMHTYNIYNVMLHIIHIQYTYDIEIWFQVQQLETSLQQGKKTNDLGKIASLICS